MEFDLRGFGIDPTMVAAFHDIFDFAEDTEPDRSHHPSHAYVRDTKAMRNTPADIIEYPNSYKFIVDMPGLRSDQVKAQIEDGNVLVVSGERRREKGKHEKEEGVKYLKMERRLGKMLKKFALSEDVNTDAFSAVLQDGVLTVTVEKKPPPEPKKVKKIEVKVGSAEVGGGSGLDVAVHGGEGMGGGGGEEEVQRSQEVTV